MLFCKIAGAKVVQIEQKTKFYLSFFEMQPTFKANLALKVRISEQKTKF